MANYCYSDFTFMVDNENKKELEKFYKIFSEIKDVIYFEEIAVKHNINTKEINCRGSIINVSEPFEDNISGLDYVYKRSGISFSSFEEISTYVEDLSDNREDIYISVFEFEISL